MSARNGMKSLRAESFGSSIISSGEIDCRSIAICPGNIMLISGMVTAMRKISYKIKVEKERFFQPRPTLGKVYSLQSLFHLIFTTDQMGLGNSACHKNQKKLYFLEALV